MSTALKVSTIQNNSQAEHLGIKSGDIIAFYNGTSIHSNIELSNAVIKANKKNLENIEIVIIREDGEIRLMASLEALGITCVETVVEIEMPAIGSTREVRYSAENELSADIILTTSMFVANQDIEKELDVITAECAYGMNIFRDFFAGVRDVVGGRSKATEKVLQDAREASMSQLRMKALQLGADAVIAIDLKYVELSGGGKNGMLLVVATGTAVCLKQ